MKQYLQQALQRISHFEDSQELANSLRQIEKSEALNNSDSYYLKESAEHIEGLFDLAVDIKRSVSQLTQNLTTKRRNIMDSVIIYGPQGCGKTRNAEALAEKYNCTSIHDEEWFDQEEVPDHALVLTTTLPPYMSTKARAIPYREAMKGIEDLLRDNTTDEKFIASLKELELNEKVDEIAELCEIWFKCRNKNRTVIALRSCIIDVCQEIIAANDDLNMPETQNAS